MVNTIVIMLQVTRMDIAMHTDGLPDLRLMQLVSPALPIGAFTYSQGLEWAIECGWVSNEGDLQDWLLGQMQDGLAHLDLPILKRLYHACEGNDVALAEHWSSYLLASRETRELRQEEINRGRALTTLLNDLSVGDADAYALALNQTQAAGFSMAAVFWQIPLQQVGLGYAWGWLENQVAAAIKLIPLGQTAGQRVQLEMSVYLPEVVNTGFNLPDDDIGASAPAVAIASSLHETQYTRLFRS